MEKEIKSVDKNIVDVVEKDPLLLDQQIDKEIIKLIKDDPKVNIMGADENANYLVDKLNKAGFNNLAKIDIYRATSMIRDPYTKEVKIPFDTCPDKTDASRDLAWKKAHEDTVNTKLEIDNNLKRKDDNSKANMVIYDTTAQHDKYTVTTKKDYSIANNE